MILRQAVMHIPLSQYAFANSETNVTIRVRVAKDNMEQCVLYYGDRVQPSDPITFTPVEMKKIATDLDFDYYDATFETPYTRVCYYFALVNAEEQLFLYADILSEKLPLERSEFYQYPFIRREEISTVPDWLKRAVVYNIFPDSFASGKRSIQGTPSETEWERGITLKSRLGGTVKGITDNLDYIADIGFNCIYINPFFTAGEYHKYDLLDYHHVSPNMGTDDDFHELVDTAHAMGIRVVIDGVFNHCSWHFFAFDDVVHNGEASAYKDWFYGLKFPVVRPEKEDVPPTYSSFAYERKMPKLNTSNPDTRAYFMEVCAHWIQDFHVDGWRLDVANEVDREFWRAFQRTARSINPESVMIGEIWESSERWLQGDMFDSAMNYDFRKNCRDFFGNGQLSAKKFNAGVTRMNLRYPTGILHGQLNLLDSHDVNRFLYHCGEDLRRLRLAVVFLFTAPGIPCVFYGDELGVTGGHEFLLRTTMPWENPPSDERDLFRRLCALRKQDDVLVYGDYRVLDMNNEGIYVFERRLRESSVIVALNAREETAALSGSVPAGAPTLSCRFDGASLGAFGYAVWKTVN